MRMMKGCRAPAIERMRRELWGDLRAALLYLKGAGKRMEKGSLLG